ncbi:hypothetical protein EON66_01730 [archaeon]|nr:MAG: hypothetical protein EON66_01730 [archaeon]
MEVYGDVRRSRAVDGAHDVGQHTPLRQQAGASSHGQDALPVSHSVFASPAARSAYTLGGGAAATPYRAHEGHPWPHGSGTPYVGVGVPCMPAATLTSAHALSYVHEVPTGGTGLRAACPTPVVDKPQRKALTYLQEVAAFQSSATSASAVRIVTPSTLASAAPSAQFTQHVRTDGRSGDSDAGAGSNCGRQEVSPSIRTMIQASMGRVAYLVDPTAPPPSPLPSKPALSPYDAHQAPYSTSSSSSSARAPIAANSARAPAESFPFFRSSAADALGSDTHTVAARHAVDEPTTLFLSPAPHARDASRRPPASRQPDSSALNTASFPVTSIHSAAGTPMGTSSEQGRNVAAPAYAFAHSPPTAAMLRFSPADVARFSYVPADRTARPVMAPHHALVSSSCVQSSNMLNVDALGVTLTMLRYPKAFAAMCTLARAWRAHHTLAPWAAARALLRRLTPALAAWPAHLQSIHLAGQLLCNAIASLPREAMLKYPHLSHDVEELNDWFAAVLPLIHGKTSYALLPICGSAIADGVGAMLTVGCHLLAPELATCTPKLQLQSAMMAVRAAAAAFLPTCALFIDVIASSLRQAPEVAAKLAAPVPPPIQTLCTLAPAAYRLEQEMRQCVSSLQALVAAISADGEVTTTHAHAASDAIVASQPRVFSSATPQQRPVPEVGCTSVVAHPRRGAHDDGVADIPPPSSPYTCSPQAALPALALGVAGSTHALPTSSANAAGRVHSGWNGRSTKEVEDLARRRAALRPTLPTPPTPETHPTAAKVLRPRCRHR